MLHLIGAEVTMSEEFDDFTAHNWPSVSIMAFVAEVTLFELFDCFFVMHLVTGGHSILIELLQVAGAS